jgi:cell division protein FtsB
MASGASTRIRAQRRPAPAIRWDRVGRVALLLVLLGVMVLYVKPLHSFWSTRNESKSRAAEVQQLERENATLSSRRDELKNPVALEREARKLGMVRPGERAYAVEGLPQTSGR